MSDRLEKLCISKGLRMTGQRRVIARVISQADDHPDVEKVYDRATEIDPAISIATVYRTVRLFEEAGILSRSDFGGARARYEEVPEKHHDHLICTQCGKIIEFINDDLERLQESISKNYQFRLDSHVMTLFGECMDCNCAGKK